MENFVLYEQVGQGDHYVIYKGRRKDTISFLAIHCAEKCKRPEITNMVRLMHEIKHNNVVRFHEWYETSNHLWLILELCTGGSLEKLISEDGHLPESCIRKFGIDLVNGLYHIHSIGIIFSDIKPSKILFNAPGDLKFADFGLSRVEGENLEKLLESYIEGGEGLGNHDSEITKAQVMDIPKSLMMRGTPNYMSPEVLLGEDPSMASDFWSLGCVFYEMFAGHPPFMNDDFEELQKAILTKELASPKVKGSQLNVGKPSPEFHSLVECLLEKDAKKRITWQQLVLHPFWQGELKHLNTDDVIFASDVKECFRQSVANFSCSISAAADNDGGKVNVDQDLSETIQNAADGRQDTDIIRQSRTLLVPKSDREPQVLFTISARPCSTGVEDEVNTFQDLTCSAMLKMPQGVCSLVKRQEAERPHDKNYVSSLVFHASDFQITPVIDIVKQSQRMSLKYDSKALSVPPIPADKLMSMARQDQVKHYTSIMDSMILLEKGPPSQKLIQLFNYVASICSSSHIANALVQRGILMQLARHVKDTQQMELKSRLCYIIGTIANNVTELDPSTAINEIISVLTEVTRDGFQVMKIKLAILPALGELLCLVSMQEDAQHITPDCWCVPSLCYSVIVRCLNESEEPMVQLLAVKVIENISTTHGQHSLKFAVNDVALQLWYIYMHATGDMLRVASLSALSRLSQFTATIIQNIIDKVGLQNLLSAMNVSVTRIQQAVITMIAAVITSDVTKQARIIQDKEFIHHVMRLFESPSVVIRAKAFLVLLVSITENNEVLLTACQNRLVMYIERDRRNQAVGKMESAEQAQYLRRCLDLLILEMVDAIPQVSKDLLTVLEHASVQKHPSSYQAKQLKNSLQLLAVLQHLTGSNVFQSQIVSECFMRNLASFLSHVLDIETGSTQIQSATGQFGMEEFIGMVFSVVENVVRHPSNVTDYASIIVDCLLPNLASLVCNCTGETRISSLQLFAEISTILINQDSSDSELIHLQIKKLYQLVNDLLLPQCEQILLDRDPLPLHGLRLLLALAEHNPAFIRNIEQYNLIQVIFQVFVDHQCNPISSTMQQIVQLLNFLVTRKETNMKSLYDHGFVEHFRCLFKEVSCDSFANDNGSSDIKASTTVLLSLLETLSGTLKYVSEIVRRALEMRKGGGDNVIVEAEHAEVLLLRNKPFTEFVCPLTQLLVHEDNDISDAALKCLSLLLQLFGIGHENSLSVKNMECYSEFLKNADLKKQKTILRLIRRLIATDSHQLEMMRQYGTSLAETIKNIEQIACSKAETALSSLASEILKIAGYNN